MNIHPRVLAKYKGGRKRYLYEPVGLTLARSAFEQAVDRGDEQAIRWMKCCVKMCEGWAAREGADVREHGV